MSTRVFTPEEQADIFKRLQEPFADDMVRWRLQHADKEGKRGMFVAYVEHRHYMDRLTELFTPNGWTKSITMTSVPTIRLKRRSTDTEQATRLLFRVTLELFGIGRHETTTETWADDENAATRGEAQGFKRACAHFGLGRYLASIAPLHNIEIDKSGRPLRPLPPPVVGSQNRAPLAAPQIVQGTKHVRFPATIERYRSQLGNDLFESALQHIRMKVPSTNPREATTKISAELGKIESMINCIAIAGEQRESEFDQCMQQLGINDLQSFPSVEALREFIKVFLRRDELARAA